MNETSRTILHRHREGLLTAVSVGFFFVLIGMLFVTVPDLLDSVFRFLNSSNWTLPAFPGTSNVFLPVPKNLSSNQTVYSAALQFSLIWGIFLIAMLIARFASSSPNRRKAENLGDIVFWLGAAYLIQTWLIDTRIDLKVWYGFWSSIVILGGIGLIARAIFLAATNIRRA